MPHPDEGLIHSWLDGELDATEAARVEALVATDPRWAAAAAEARGLIAASGRIAAALDRVPANVIPRAVPVRRGSRQWVWRAAAAIMLLAGSAVVLERRGPELPIRAAADRSKAEAALPRAPSAGAPGSVLARTDSPAHTTPTEQSARRAAAPSPAPARPAAAADSVSKMRSSLQQKDLYTEKQAYLADAKAGVSAQGVVPAGTGGTAIAPRALANRAAPPQVQCFEQRQPPDSAKRIITIDARALADSVRLGTLAIRGDTISAANGRLTAVRVQCPER